MARKPEYKDIYCVKETINQIGDCWYVKLNLSNIQCPICSMKCQGIIDTKAIWDSPPVNIFNLSSEFDIKCNDGCKWAYYKYHRCENYEFDYHDIEGWKEFCDSWEQINKKYRDYENVYYDIEKKYWCNNETSICPVCLSNNIYTCREEDSFIFMCESNNCCWCYTNDDIDNMDFNHELLKERAKVLTINR